MADSDLNLLYTKVRLSIHFASDRQTGKQRRFDRKLILSEEKFRQRTAAMVISTPTQLIQPRNTPGIVEVSHHDYCLFG